MLAPPYQLPEREPFPTVERLRRGVLLRTLLEVVSAMPGHAPSDAFEWDGSILRLNDYGGTHGCVSFTPDRVVAGFFDINSERSPFDQDTFPPYNAEHYFTTAPQDVLAIARRAVLPQLERWIGDPAVMEQAIEHAFDPLADIDLDMTKFTPVISAAFWSEGEVLTADEQWPTVYFHGANILWQEFSEPDAVLAYWEQEFGVPRERLALARRLYERRLATDEPVLVLTAEEYAELLASGAPKLAPLQTQFAAIGIALPS